MIKHVGYSMKAKNTCVCWCVVWVNPKNGKL